MPVFIKWEHLKNTCDQIITAVIMIIIKVLNARPLHSVSAASPMIELLRGNKKSEVQVVVTNERQNVEVLWLRT